MPEVLTNKSGLIRVVKSFIWFCSVIIVFSYLLPLVVDELLAIFILFGYFIQRSA